MSKFYREEVSYKKVYATLDVNKDLGIKWPSKCEEKKTVKVSISDDPEPISYAMDDKDISFCKENNVDEKDFIAGFTKLDETYNDVVTKKLESIAPFKIDSHCDICGYEDDEKINKMLTCQGCGIPVHQECYGVADFTEKWLCKKCEEGDFEAQCEFCEVKDGILKKTDQNEWIHAVCGLLNSTMGVLNEITKEPIETEIYQPILGECVECQKESETLVECSFSGCGNAFHISCVCGLLYMDLANKVVYCNDHYPVDDPMTFLSRKNHQERQEMVTVLKKEVYEREDKKLNPVIETEYKAAIETPTAIILEKENKNSEDALAKYWEEKRNHHKNTYSNFYLFTNAYRGQH